MSATLSYLLLVVAGFALGVLFYGGLWATVRALPTARHPLLLALGSFWGRTGLVVAGFVLLAAGRWQNAIACLAGVLLARAVLAHRLPRVENLKRSSGTNLATPGNQGSPLV